VEKCLQHALCGRIDQPNRYYSPALLNHTRTYMNQAHSVDWPKAAV